MSTFLLFVAFGFCAFVGGFYLGVVYGAPAWRDWARDEHAKRQKP